MKAYVVTTYGPHGLEAADLSEPRVGASDVLVDVRAASINPLDKMVRDGESGPRHESRPRAWAAVAQSHQ